MSLKETLVELFNMDNVCTDLICDYFTDDMQYYEQFAPDDELYEYMKRNHLVCVMHAQHHTKRKIHTTYSFTDGNDVLYVKFSGNIGPAGGTYFDKYEFVNV